MEQMLLNLLVIAVVCLLIFILLSVVKSFLKVVIISLLLLIGVLYLGYHFNVVGDGDAERWQRDIKKKVEKQVDETTKRVQKDINEAWERQRDSIIREELEKEKRKKRD